MIKHLSYGKLNSVGGRGAKGVAGIGVFLGDMDWDGGSRVKQSGSGGGGSI